MDTLRKIMVISLVMVGAMVPVAFAADEGITGTWTMNVDTAAGNTTPTFNLKQSGKDVTGTYKGVLGELPVTGNVSGKEVTLKFTVSSMSLDVTYTGTVDGNTMKGKVSLGALGEGTFTGQKS